MQPSAADDEIEKILEERLKMAELEIERMGPNSKSPKAELGADAASKKRERKWILNAKI